MTVINNGKTLTQVPRSTSVTDVQGCTSAPWKDPVTGRDFRNDPERDNHLFDSRRPFHGKDDVRVLNNLLKRLQDLGGDRGFPHDYQNNPSGKMRAVMHSGRVNKKTKKAYSAKHNDRNFKSEADHIVKDKSGNNVIWNIYGDGYTFEQAELKFYKENFSQQLNHTNECYRKSRHKERIKTMEKWMSSRQHCPEDTIQQIGAINNHPDVEKSLECFYEYLDWLNKWNDEHGKPFTILDWALHQDEQGAPHFHVRKVWTYIDPETGFLTTGQTKALELAGVQRPYPNQKAGQKNNPKITFDKMCREKWISIARKHGLEIEDRPKPKDQVGLTLEEFQKREDEKRNEIYNLLTQYTSISIGMAEKITEWEEIIPTIEKFDKLVEQNCKQAKRTYDSEEFAGYVKQIVSAHAKDMKSVQDKGDAEIKRLDRELNGHNYWKGYDLHHQFGAKEINEMLSQATPEQLEKISAVMKANGYADLGSWMNNTKRWYKQFPKGMQIQKELERKNQGMSY